MMGYAILKKMKPFYSDTDQTMESLQIELLRKATPCQKLKILADLNASAQMLALAGLRSRYSHETEARLQRRLADLLLGQELACKVYGEPEDAA